MAAKAKTKPKAKTGRKLLPLDEATIADLAFRGASNRDIAALVGCDESVIRRRFPAILDKKRAERRMAIRDAQSEQAKQGNAAILVWLGKNELDQTDKAQPVQTNVVVKYEQRDINGQPAGPASQPAANPE